MQPILYYIYDPMCSWCWGFKPVWSEVKKALRDKVSIQYVLGGLAPETTETMPEDMQFYLQQSWKRIEEMTGVKFNHDFWTNNRPQRSTYPACKAALVARQSGKELEMFERIQRLYYLEAGNPSDYENLVKLAEDIGLDKDSFEQAIHSSKTEQALLKEIEFAESLPISGFPSLVLRVDNQDYFIQHSYTSVQENLELIYSKLNSE